MTQTKENRRVTYTKTVLRESLLKLMTNKSINDITVTELCQQADINRGTFYTYYKTPYVLLEQIESELYARMQNEIEATPAQLSEAMVRIMSAEPDLCLVLFGKNGDSAFNKQMVKLTYDSCMLQWKLQYPQLSEQQLNWMFEYASQGSSALLIRWLEDGMKEEPQEIIQFIETFCRLGASGLIQKAL